MKKFLSFPFVLLFFGSCKRENVGNTDTQPPTVSITSPAANQSVPVGTTLAIKATVSDDTKLAEIHLEITNKTTGAFITHEHFAPDGPTYSLSSSFTPTSAAAYKIKVEADDTAGNSREAEITVTAN